MWIVIKTYVNICSYTEQFYFTKVYQKSTYFNFENTKNVYIDSYYQSIFFIRDTWSYFLWSMDYLTLRFWEIKKVFYCIVFCGLLRFICWKLSQELDKKHCMIKNFCHNSTIFLDWCRYFQIKLQVDLSEKKFNIFIMNEVCWWFILY